MATPMAATISERNEPGVAVHALLRVALQGQERADEHDGPDDHHD